MSKERLNMLLVEDEGDFRQIMQKSFGNLYRIINAPNATQAIMGAKNSILDLIVLDLNLDKSTNTDKDGLALIEPLKTYAPNVPIIVVTKNKESQTAVKALRLGADDFIRKDEFDAEKFKKIFDLHIEKKSKTVSNLTAAKVTESKDTLFIGETQTIKELKKFLLVLSNKPDVTVLLTGESGVGKEVAARYLHQYGVRQHQPFEAVHLSGITKTLLEDTLFGHRKGSFTDARVDTKGVFEKANGGVLFLDEIGEIDANTQVKLLRFLEDKTITPIGGDHKKLDIQIVAATNKNLEKEVEKGHFRLDLYHRLSQFPLEIPPLRERTTDIPLLIQHILSSEEVSKQDFTTQVWERLHTYHWPGNVRELVNTIKGLCLKRDLLEKKQIDYSLLPKAMLTASSINISTTNSFEENDVATKQAIIELEAIEQSLINNRGSKSKTATQFEMSLDNLRYKIGKYYELHPTIFEKFPEISRKYKLH